MPPRPTRTLARGSLLAAALLWPAVGHAALTAPNGKSTAPVPAATLALMAKRDMAPDAPILVRTFKKEAEMEVWKMTRGGRYVLLKTFPICRWSGQLGPKVKDGDRQTPEGFYPITPKQMNPYSHYYLSFDTGFPNAYDRAHGATGSALMVHGTCSSAGCYAMTDKGVGEIYALARDALAGGQAAFQFQAFPFRLSAQNVARHRTDPNIGFWRQLKEGSDRFEATGEEPVAGVANGHYVFAPLKDPAQEALAVAHHVEEEKQVAALVADGSAAVRTSYSDGGQHPAFAALLRQGASLGDVSRPEALAFAGLETILIPARPKKKPALPVVLASLTSDTKAAAPVPPPDLVAPAPMALAPLAPVRWAETSGSAERPLIAGAIRILSASLIP